MGKTYFIILFTIITTQILSARVCGCVDASQLKIATKQIIQNFYNKDTMLNMKYSNLKSSLESSQLINENLNKIYLINSKQMTKENLANKNIENKLSNQNAIMSME